MVKPLSEGCVNTELRCKNIIWSPQLQPFCVGDMLTSKSTYNLNQSVVEKFPSFVKLVSPFRKPIHV